MISAPLVHGDHENVANTVGKPENAAITAMLILCLTMCFDRYDCKKAAPQSHVARAHENFRNRV